MLNALNNTPEGYSWMYCDHECLPKIVRLAIKYTTQDTWKRNERQRSRTKKLQACFMLNHSPPGKTLTQPPSPPCPILIPWDDREAGHSNSSPWEATHHTSPNRPLRTDRSTRSVPFVRWIRSNSQVIVVVYQQQVLTRPPPPMRCTCVRAQPNQNRFWYHSDREPSPNNAQVDWW